MNLKNLTTKAKDLLDKRGGTGSLKEDAAELKEIATGKGSLTDKAKAAAAAIKDPGTDDQPEPAAPPPTDAPVAEATPAETERAGKVEREERGKGRGGRDGDPAV
jgi:hypothetical protein